VKVQSDPLIDGEDLGEGNDVDANENWPRNSFLDAFWRHLALVIVVDLQDVAVGLVLAAAAVLVDVASIAQRNASEKTLLANF